MKQNILFFLTLGLVMSCSEDNVIPESPAKDQPTLYTLPVVVHVIHSGQALGDGLNLSEQRIKEQIQSLNDDFRRTKGTLGENNSSLSEDAFIQFKLAEIDPEGNATDGIVRLNYFDFNVTPDFSLHNVLPQISYWDPEKYINIWAYGGLVANELLGQASLPHGDYPGLPIALTYKGDGVVINSNHFGKSNVETYNLGKTLTHEMGHFLGLWHLWGNGPEGKPCEEFDDFVEDTPHVSSRSNSCSGTILLNCNGQPVPVHNYMDLSTDECMNSFTKGQIVRMRYILENLKSRQKLITSISISR